MYLQLFRPESPETEPSHVARTSTLLITTGVPAITGVAPSRATKKKKKSARSKYSYT